MAIHEPISIGAVQTAQYPALVARQAVPEAVGGASVLGMSRMAMRGRHRLRVTFRSPALHDR